MHKSILRRMAASCAGLAMAWSGAAQAAEVEARGHFDVDKWAAHLGCLKTQLPGTLTAGTPAGAEPQLFRAVMLFNAADAPPSVSWLWKGDASAASQLASKLRDSRMPCLESKESQRVLQEFWWTPGTGVLEVGEAWPIPTTDQISSGISCYATPEGGMLINQPSRELSNLLFRFRFPKDGGPVKVDTVHRVGSGSFFMDARRYVRRFQPCAGGRTKLGVWHQVTYASWPYGTQSAEPKTLDLNEFLGQVKGAKSLRARFDTHTMNCPFTVDLRLYQPARSNQASVQGGLPIDQYPFLSWLQRLQIDLPATEEAIRFSETIQIKVPCQLVDLK